MNTGKFIIAFDAETAQELLKQGLLCMNGEGEKRMFLNSGNIRFSDEIKKKIVFTDKLNF